MDLQQNRARQLDDWVGQLNAYLSAEDLPEAKRLLDELQRIHPDFWDEAAIAATLAEYKRLDNQDSVRRTELAACIQEIESADHLDPSVDEKHKEARRLARFEEERLQVAQLRERIARSRRDHQSGVDGEFQRALAGLNEEYREILAAAVTDEDRILQLDRLATRYDDAMRVVDASDELIVAAREQLGALRSDSFDRRQKVQRSKAVEAALAKLQAARHDLASYAISARQFVDAFPERPEARALQSVLKNSPAWEHIERWNELAQSWKGRLTVRDAETADRFGRSVAELPGVLKNVIGDEMLSSLSGYFARATVALNPTDSGIARVGRLFEQPWMRDLQYVSSKEGERYYVLSDEVKEISSDPPTYAISGVVRSLDALVEPASRKKQIIATIGDPELRKAPHCSFAHQQGQYLRQLRPGRWQTIHLELAKRVTIYPGIDPVLRLELARVYLKWHIREGWPATEGDRRVRRFLDRIDQAEFGHWKLSEVPWPDTISSAVRQARETAEELLKQFPNLDELITGSDAAFRELQRRAKVWRPIGLMWRNEHGEPDVLGSIPEGPFGIVHLGDAGRVEFHVRGRSAKDGVSFSGGDFPEFGTPLYGPPPWNTDREKEGDE